VPCAAAEAAYHADHRVKVKHGRGKCGHYQHPANVYTRPDGSTRCRECMADQEIVKRARRASLELAA
jgi:hypothetical protein